MSRHCDHHDSCVASAVEQLQAYCREHQLRLTPLRQRVFELVWSSHKPIGAYAVLEGLSEDGRRPSPPTVYRSLDFLLEHRLIHRIASMNAYLGCAHPGQRHAAQFFICRQCGDAREMADQQLEQAVQSEAQEIGFEADLTTVEVLGTCRHCLESDVQDS